MHGSEANQPTMRCAPDRIQPRTRSAVGGTGIPAGTLRAGSPPARYGRYGLQTTMGGSVRCRVTATQTRRSKQTNEQTSGSVALLRSPLAGAVCFLPLPRFTLLPQIELMLDVAIQKRLTLEEEFECA